ncbi:hypothetical protein G6F37_010271 [Rhizopus arrhizus]|nr:hypothetical protein G6F38_009804 [Rhizopus arrhizus]KAG1153535.1 hypothetical protein G6F37_010271 [Rhizopus arrhizus]
MNVIINQYKQRLVDISGAVKDEDVKKYIASLLEDVGNKSTEEQSGLTLSNCSNVNIASVSYGTQVMSTDHSNKKRKIFEEPASLLSSTPLASSPLQTSPADLAQTTNSYESLYYDTDDEFESEEETEIVVEEDNELGKHTNSRGGHPCNADNAAHQTAHNADRPEQQRRQNPGRKERAEENAHGDTERKGRWTRYPTGTQRNAHAGHTDGQKRRTLENLNVIQLGNKIGSESTRKYYPKDLIDKTEMIIKEIPDSFVKDQDFYNRIFDTITLADEQSSNELLAEVYFSVFKSTYFCYGVSGLFIEDSDVYELETNYNYRIIWPIIDRLSKMIETTRFQPGGVRLQAICDELKLVHKDNSSYYNADGVIINNKHNIEIAAVETTGPFHLSNNSKETQDYIKAGYGLISILHCIDRKLPYGNFDTFKRIGVFFIQVTPTKLRIWRVLMPHSKLYIKNCIGSVEVPTAARTSEENLRKLVNLL